MSTILLGKTLKGADVVLDLQQLITGRTFLCGVSDAGKSYTGRRIVEQAFGKTGIVIVDVEGEYATLREKFPFLIIGKDVPLVPEAAEYLADQVLEHGLSTIIDGSDASLDAAAFQEFVARFVNRFITVETAKRTPYLFILEEADELAPEKGILRSLCLDAVIKLVKKGRKRGLGVIALTQRAAFVSKFVVSQCQNKLIGRIEWPDDIAVLEKFLRIIKKDLGLLGELKRGQFYVAGPFVDKAQVVMVGAVITTHAGATPELVPPAPKELKTIVAQLSEKLPGIIQEQLVPAVPKVAEIEARLKEKLEAQWQARLTRVEKEKNTIKNKTEAKYEVEVADLKRKLEEAARSAALQGGAVSDLMQHPLVVAAFKKAELDERQQSLVELLEKNPRTNEQLRLFLQTGSDGVDHVRRAINKKIPGLIDLEKGQYVSRLAKLFPVTEEAQAEAKEVDELKRKVTYLEEQLKGTVLEAVKYKHERDELAAQVQEMRQLVANVALERDELRANNNTPTTPTTHAVPGTPDAPTAQPTPATSGLPLTISADEAKEVQVKAKLRRTLTEFNVATSTEVLDADESTPIGRLLASGLRGFFQTEQDIDAISAEIQRKYSITANSGGNKAVYQKALEKLVAKDILDRRDNNGAWVYKATGHFTERVRPFQEASA